MAAAKMFEQSWHSWDMSTHMRRSIDFLDLIMRACTMHVLMLFALTMHRASLSKCAFLVVAASANCNCCGRCFEPLVVPWVFFVGVGLSCHTHIYRMGHVYNMPHSIYVSGLIIRKRLWSPCDSDSKPHQRNIHWQHCPWPWKIHVHVIALLVLHLEPSLTHSV